jgi:microcystin-dependent protein
VATPYLGELKIVAFNFPPKGWAFANGQLLPINQNQALFSLLGTQYGGNGQTTFALPNVQGRTPMHFGSGPAGSINIGQVGGEENHTLNILEMPAHGHGLAAQSGNAVQGAPPGAGSFANASNKPYRTNMNLGQAAVMAPQTFPGGGSQPHANLQPYLTLNIVIALQGVFPSRN